VAAQTGGRKVDQMGDGSATPGAGPPASADDDAPTQPVVARAPATAPWPAGLAIPPPPPPPAELVPPWPQTEARPPGPPPEVRPPAPPTEVRPPAPEVRAPAPPTEIRPPAPEVRPPPPPTPVRPPAPATEVGPAWAATDAGQRRPRPEIGPRPEIRPFQPPTGIVRYGPGVPAGPSAQQPGLSAERVWRTGQPDVPGRRRPRLRRLLGSSLTVILLAASGVVLYLRFHHAPFHVTGVVISQQTRTGCGVDVTGRIATNGAAGTVSYQWLFQPGQQPQPLSQSVIAGQHAVYVTVAVQGSGHGRASQTVTLQVLGPDPGNASTAVVINC
jgi:hypothetical protein